jgi:pimeloyl-ACP methyl ester carboxylesterase
MAKSSFRLLHALSLFSLAISTAVNGRAKVPLPALPGSYSVGTISLEMIDQSRIDPYAPTPQPRAIMVSFFYPTSDIHHPFAPYLPAELAAIADQYLKLPAGFIENIQPQAHLNARLKEIRDIPIILFSPGLGGAREEYTILLEGLASYGYLVIAIDHTYDALIVEFPDGTIVVGGQLNGDAKSLDVRTKDSSFVIDQLSNKTFITQIPGIVHRTFKESKIAMFGHSLGGTTTLSVLEADTRVLGGVSLDGPIFGAEEELGTTKPFLMVGRDNHTRYNDPAWAEVWKHLTGWKSEITLTNSTHFTFADNGAIFTEAGLIDFVDPGRLMYGSIDQVRATVVEIAYLKAFFDFVLKGGKDTMFKHADPAFPEITIV